MKYVKLFVVVFAVAVFAILGAQGGDMAHAQSDLPTPTNVQADNGPNSGEAILTWDAVAGANFYRVGWITVEGATQAIADGADIFNYYAFVDISGATTYTVAGLSPGVEYFFTVASLQERFGKSAQAFVVRLTLNADGAACPVCPTCPATGTPPTTQPLPTAPVGGDYDADDDGLIEIRSITQLDAIRYDLDGDGSVDEGGDATTYGQAFPGAAAGMGCPATGCSGYELANDLDYGTTVISKGWLPIGYRNSDEDIAPFTATFDGNGHTIANLLIIRSTTDYIGLFGYTGAGSVIRRVGLTSMNVVGNDNVGGLVGSNAGGAISDSYATGNAIGNQDVGGLAGDNRNDGTITDSYANVDVSGNAGLGGLAGHNHGDINRSHATGAVAGGGSNVGGLVGFSGSSGTITASYATGSAQGGDDWVGGLVGSNLGAITASYATSYASGRIVGGLAGINHGSITASYAKGGVYGTRGGGLIGKNEGEINGSYATGWIGGCGYFCSLSGGLVGYRNNGAVTSSYWDTVTSGRGDSYAGSGWTTAELRSPTGATGIYATWNPNWWDFGTSEQYPVLKVQGLSVALQRGEAPPSSAVPGSTAPAETDRVALVALYNATGGANWVNNDGWLSDRPIGEWHGVTTDGSGRVAELRLPGNGLSGTLPAELGSLAGLAWLDLDYNQLSGAIPAAVGNLSNLTVLRLGSNDLSGAIPPALGRLSSLSILGLGNNRLTGPIPPELGNLASLTRMSAWNNQLTGPIPPELSSLSQLTKLSLGLNQLSGPIPPQLGNLSNLEELALPENQLTGVIPSELGRLTNLTRLNLDYNRLSGTIPSELGDLASLTVLRLGSNRLTGAIPPDLGSLSSLSILGLGNNQLSGQLPAALGNLNRLTKVSMFNNQLTGPIPAELGNLAKLTYLNLGSNQLSGPIPAELGNLSSIARMYLYDNQLTGSIPGTLGRLSKLDTLNLSHNRLTGSIPEELSASGNAANLHYDRSYDSQSTAAPPVKWGGRSSNIDVLYVGADPRSNAAPPPALGSLSSLRVLNLSHNGLAGAIPPGLGSLSRLKRLYLNGNNALTPNTPAAVSSLDLEVRRLSDDEADNPCTQAGAASAASIANDKQALQDLFTITDGRGHLSGSRGNPKWHKFGGWEETFEGKEVPLDEWYGITTSDSGRVIGISLRGNNLQGNLDEWTEKLQGLISKNTGANHALYCLDTLDLGENPSLDGNFEAVLSALPLRPGETLTANVGVGGEDLTYVESPDISALTNKIEEETGGDVKLEVPEMFEFVANWGLKLLSKTAGSGAGRIIGKPLGPVGTILGNEEITDVFIGVAQGKNPEDIQLNFISSFGISPDCDQGFYAGCNTIKDVSDNKKWCENIHGVGNPKCANR